MTELEEFLQLKCRRIRLEDYKVQAHIGALESEKHRTQEVLISIDVWVEDLPIHSDDLSAVYDYRALVDAIEKTLLLGHIELQETLADHIACALLSDTRVVATRIATRKTEAIAKAKSIGIEIFRLRKSSTTPL